MAAFMEPIPDVDTSALEDDFQSSAEGEAEGGGVATLVQTDDVDTEDTERED
jgi:hypothetical protein